MKNIVICCDGTDNKLTVDENTNVLHFFSCLDTSGEQLLYYNPGVGTIWTKNSLNLFKKFFKKVDQIKALSLTNNVIDAYKYLMNNYEKGDKVFLIGFSRGAYTVRMLSGLLEMYGLLYKGNENHLKYLLEIYYLNDKEKWHIANKFKKRFASDIQIEFLGIWDTVVSVGGILKSYNAFPYSSSLDNVKIIRHAVAIDERRKHFKPSFVKKGHSDLKEVWFAGVHSDVGGGYKEEGLSKIALEWMLNEAITHGILVSKEHVNKYLYGLNTNKYLPPDHMGNLHDSFRADFNWFFDFFPRKRSRRVEKTKGNRILEYYFDFDYCPVRQIKEESMLHESVLLKIKEDKNYKPTNIELNDLDKYTIEKWIKIIM